MKNKNPSLPYSVAMFVILLMASCKNSYDTAPVVDTAMIASLDCLHAHYSPVAQANSTYVGTIEIGYTGGEWRRLQCRHTHQFNRRYRIDCYLIFRYSE